MEPGEGRRRRACDRGGRCPHRDERRRSRPRPPRRSVAGAPAARSRRHGAGPALRPRGERRAAAPPARAHRDGRRRARSAPRPADHRLQHRGLRAPAGPASHHPRRRLRALPRRQPPRSRPVPAASRPARGPALHRPAPPADARHLARADRLRARRARRARAPGLHLRPDRDAELAAHRDARHAGEGSPRRGAACGTATSAGGTRRSSPRCASSRCGIVLSRTCAASCASARREPDRAVAALVDPC